MTSNPALPINDNEDNRLSTEKLPESSRDVHRESETTFSSPEIVPAYKPDVDLEPGIEKRPDNNKLADNASTESPQKVGGPQEIEDDEDYPPGFVTRTWRRYRPFGHAIIWLLLTAYIFQLQNSNCRWWICGLILHRDKWLIPFLLYLAVTLWLIFRYVSISVVSL